MDGREEEIFVSRHPFIPPKGSVIQTLGIEDFEDSDGCSDVSRNAWGVISVHPQYLVGPGAVDPEDFPQFRVHITPMT